MKLIFSLSVDDKDYYQKNDKLVFFNSLIKEYPALKKYKGIYTVVDMNKEYLKLNTGFWVRRTLFEYFPLGKKI